jgi:hypothetical protein
LESPLCRHFRRYRGRRDGTVKIAHQTAVRDRGQSRKPTIGQLRQLRRLEPNVNNMTAAQLKQSLSQIFSPEQLGAIRHSLAAQGVSLPSH